MLHHLRQPFNEAFSPETYRAFLAQIEADYPGLLDFRVAETPVFVPQELTRKLIRACDAIIDVITADTFRQQTDGAIPPHQRVPHENSHPSFLAIDFAVCRDEAGHLTPQLIELQGFPSLFGYQSYLAQLFRRFYPIPDTVSHLFNVDTDEAYRQHLRRLILGRHAPENVILLEIFPEKQKTRLDFAITRDWLGIEPVCLTKIRKDGRRLYYEKDGRRLPIHRIYNRLIFDELDALGELPTDFRPTDDVDVEWAAHPNWFFRVSKYTLPLLNSPFVPKSFYLDQLTDYPDDLENYVLKPLFSFAGTGVRLHVTRDDLDRLPDRRQYLLQRKVRYEPVVESPTGGVKCELRMLYGWPDDDARPTLLTNLARLSRGEMIGVNFNRNVDWVGGTVGFFEP